jgi:hypothetical protein
MPLCVYVYAKYIAEVSHGLIVVLYWRFTQNSIYELTLPNEHLYFLSDPEF